MPARTVRRRPLLEAGRLVPLLVLLAAAPGAWLWWGDAAGWIPAALLYLGILSALTLALFAWDKRAAVRSRRRVSEANLLLSSLFGGAAGALLGMHGLRHKTRHARFRVLVPLSLCLHVAAVVALARSGA